MTVHAGIREKDGQTAAIPDPDRRKHALGKIGVGKTTLMYNMAFADLYAGVGFSVIDPHEFCPLLVTAGKSGQMRHADIFLDGAALPRHTAFLTPFPDVAQSIALATRSRLLETFPDAVETAEGRNLRYGFDRSCKGLVFTVSPKKRGVNLGIVGGAWIDDSDGCCAGQARCTAI